MAKQKKTSQVVSSVKNARKKYYLQMLDLKADSNMTRIYSIMKNSSFLNNTN